MRRKRILLHFFQIISKAMDDFEQTVLALFNPVTVQAHREQAFKLFDQVLVLPQSSKSSLYYTSLRVPLPLSSSESLHNPLLSSYPHATSMFTVQVFRGWMGVVCAKVHRQG